MNELKEYIKTRIEKEGDKVTRLMLIRVLEYIDKLEIGRELGIFEEVEGE